MSEAEQDLTGEITPEVVETNDDEPVEPSPTPEVAAEAPEPKKNRVQDRINQLTRKNHEEKQKNAELEQRLVELETKSQSEKKEIVAPKEDDFDTVDQFTSANTEYIANVASNKAYERVSAETQQKESKAKLDAATEAFTKKQDKYFERVESKKDGFEDFNNVAHGHEFMDQDLAEQIFEMEKGPEVAYHLGLHLDVAEEIFAMTPVKRARELTKLEFTVEGLKPKKVSGAPNPITPLGGGTEGVEKSPDKMTDAEWLRWRNNQINARIASNSK